MNWKHFVFSMSVALLLIALGLPAMAESRNYKATFDLYHMLNGGMTLLGAEPVMTIHNPQDNERAMEVKRVDLVWTPKEYLGMPAPGVTKHNEPRVCTIVDEFSPQGLGPGEGLTVNAIDAIEDCPTCRGTPCGPGRPACPGSCTCLPVVNECFPLTLPPGGTPWRVTFDVLLDDGNIDLDGDGEVEIYNPYPASVRTLDFLTDGESEDGQVIAVEGGEVDMDAVQQIH